MMLLLTMLGLAFCVWAILRWLSYTKLRQCAAALDRIDGALTVAIRAHLRDPWREYDAAIEDSAGRIMLIKKSSGGRGALRRVTVHGKSVVYHSENGALTSRGLLGSDKT